MKLTRLSLISASVVFTTLASAMSFALPAPWQYHRISGYDAAAESQSTDKVHKALGGLVQKYNARFKAGVEDIADKSEASAKAFIAVQNQVIARLKADGRVSAAPILVIDADSGAMKFDFYSVTDENSDLAALLMVRSTNKFKRNALSTSILALRPTQALSKPQTIQDAKDVTAFYIQSTSGIDARTGGTLNLMYATNVKFSPFGSQPKLSERTFAAVPVELAKAGGVWVARNAKGAVSKIVIQLVDKKPVVSVINK